MICVYDLLNDHYDTNGDAVLTPTSGSVRQVAGGNYDLTMEHPMDPEGKWQLLVPEAVIKAPVPRELIQNAMSGMEADLYKTTASAALRSGTSEPQTITYTTWSISANYSVGDKVSWNGKNYQCNFYDETSPYAHIAPSSCSWWKEIAREIPGSPVLVKLKSGTELYYVSGPTNGWYKMMTKYGLEGYIKASQVEFVRHLTPAETKPRTVTEQLFRIRTVNVDNDGRKVTVTAQHVSYDLNGILIDKVKIVRQQPPYALAWIEEGLMAEYKGTIATNIISNSDTSYSAEISGKSGTYALLDPDKGVVKTFDAMLQRDNWDFFIMEKQENDRGFVIRYGANMRGVQWKRNSENLVLRVVPVAKKADGSNLYLENTKWVSSSHASDYPVKRMQWLKVDGQVGKDDGTETDTNWTETTLRAEMQKQAEARFSVDKADEPAEEVTVSFEMLGDTEEYAWMKDLQDVLLYDTVTVIDQRSGISVKVTVDELEYDIVKKKITALKLTNAKHYYVQSVSGYNVQNNAIEKGKLTEGAEAELRDSAIDQSSEYTDKQITDLNSSLRGWVTSNFVHQ